MSVLKQAREAAGLTQGQLATKSGVAAGTIAHIEGGRKSVTAGIAVAVAPSLGVSPVALLLDSVKADALRAVKSAVEGHHTVDVAGLDAVRVALTGLTRFSDDPAVPVEVRVMAKEMVGEVIAAMEAAAKSGPTTSSVRRDGLGRSLPEQKPPIRRDLYGRARRDRYGGIKRG